MVKEWISRKAFSAVHLKNLVYNTCWEDPRLDRQALQLTPDDNVLVITSAGCNALDYALEGPANVHAVDMNPLQNALLELKAAAIRSLDYEDFFDLFGRGAHANWRDLYHDAVRGELPGDYQPIWDRRLDFFDASNRRQSFYFRGTSGWFAWMMNAYLNRTPLLRSAVEEMLEAPSVEHQQDIFNRQNVSKMMWRRPLRWVLRRDTTLAMLGVPRSQRNQIDSGYPGGIGQFIQDRIETVFSKLPLHDNYFWRVYLTGQYTPACCPEYLKRENFQKLKEGLVDRVHTHTNTVAGFLQQHEPPISRFVLLDHMDWLHQNHPQVLTEEWQSIIDRAAESARVLWRSAALKVDFVDPLSVFVGGKPTRIGDLLSYQTTLAERLHLKDRVHTYGSFYIADVAV